MNSKYFLGHLIYMEVKGGGTVWGASVTIRLYVETLLEKNLD